MNQRGMDETLHSPNGALYSPAISPGGTLYLAASETEGTPLAPALAARIHAAFDRGPGHGILHLGAVEFSEELGPTLGFWRDLGKLFVTKLSAAPDEADKLSSSDKAAPPEPASDGLWAELSTLLEAAPPMLGTEYLSEEVLQKIWALVYEAFLTELHESGGDLATYLRSKHEIWNMVGRVWFHLAENKASKAHPFAFLSTYTARVSNQARLQHVPLGRALKEQAAAGQKKTLLGLLLPVQKASAASPFLKELVDSGKAFHPQAWTPAEAYRFLKDVPVFEENGVLVRVPDWWKPRSPPRVRVNVTLGRSAAEGLGIDALLDFEAGLALDGEPISAEEWEEILEGTQGLVLVKSKWVEVDRERLKEALASWKEIQKTTAREGVSFLQAMRLLAGGSLDLDARDSAPETAALEEWSQVHAGDWLARTLSDLRRPEGLNPVDVHAGLEGTLRPYQEIGVKWLWFLYQLRLGACLADDMGLGKTIQVLALLLLVRQERGKARSALPSLLVVPASLIGNWKAELGKFAPKLEFLIAHPSEMGAEELSSLSPARLEKVSGRLDLVITTYGSLHRQEWLRKAEWDLVILDEAQAIKNPEALQTKAATSLKSSRRLALTGTPVENRLGDLWSIFHFLNPGLLGTSKEFKGFLKSKTQDDSRRYGTLRNLVRPYILRRLKSDKQIISDLPDKTELDVFCNLTKKQAALYQQSVEALREGLKDMEGMQRRGTILAFLMRFKQICNHPAQWTGDGNFDPTWSGKFSRLAELCQEIATRQEKLLIFTQFRELTDPLASFVEGIFGRPGLVLDGETPVKQRKKLVDEFQMELGPPFFVLSLKAGGSGLNLTAASHVIHFDRWWNPAVENQATDRAYRIGQRKNVLVHKFICRGTIEEKIDELIAAKKAMSNEILEGGAQALLTEMGTEELMKLVSLDMSKAALEA